MHADSSYKRDKIYFKFGVELLKYKKDDLALEIFEELLNSGDNSSCDEASYKNNIGTIYTNKKEYEKAKKYFSEAMELNEYDKLYKENYDLMVKVLD